MNEDEVLNVIIEETKHTPSSFDYSGGVLVLPSADPVIIQAIEKELK